MVKMKFKFLSDLESVESIGGEWIDGASLKRLKAECPSIDIEEFPLGG